jgi:hypothetical protein
VNPNPTLPRVAQVALYSPLRRATLSVWGALDLLGTLREYETALLEEEGLDPTLPLPEHAAGTAEACRAAFPDLDWLHLVGLLHSLGKLLAHKRCGARARGAVAHAAYPGRSRRPGRAQGYLRQGSPLFGFGPLCRVRTHCEPLAECCRCVL